MAKQKTVTYTPPTFSPVDLTNKDAQVSYYIKNTLNKTLNMFEYKGLPKNINPLYLEKFLQLNGYVAVTKVNGELFAFYGGLGGELDEYYRPTVFTLANPYLGVTGNYKIYYPENKEISRYKEMDFPECVIIRNDYLYMGILPTLSYYSTFMTENAITLKLSLTNKRIMTLISAGDDRTATAAKAMLEDIEKGKLGIITDNALLEALKTLPYSTANSNINDCIELQQYLKAQLLNEVGINANYNMKREALNSAESALNDDALIPSPRTMLQSRKEGVSLINAVFGTNISVEFSSVWRESEMVEEFQAEQLKTPQNRNSSPETATESEKGDNDVTN